MRTQIVALFVVIGIASTAYFALREDMPLTEIEPVARQGESIAAAAVNHEPELEVIQARLDELVGVVQRYRDDSEKSWKRAQKEQVQLSKTIADLSSRIGAAEGNSNTEEREASASDSDVDTSESSESRRISESDLGHWMDDALQVGNVNRGATDSAINQAATSLEQAPGLVLEDMKCSEAFCRATLASETGERPTLQDLYGRPPFVNEGFTIDEPDGRVMVYFTPPEVSLEDLRAEARQVAEFDLSQ